MLYYTIACTDRPCHILELKLVRLRQLLILALTYASSEDLALILVLSVTCIAYIVYVYIIRTVYKQCL